jgi:PAS domain S-box-containing protein
MDIAKECECCCTPNSSEPHCTSDAPIEATSEELALIRGQLMVIEELLSRLFGAEVYSRRPESVETRRAVADLMEDHFDGIVEEWTQAVMTIIPGRPGDDERETRLRGELSNALIRFILHLRDPDDLRTYVHLRKHCQEGMLARAKPSEFNTVHIALKQVILRHVSATLQGERVQRVRDAVVAAIDERRLMVSQFYIESRERMLRASEEKYRNSINHAPDPMYEIEPGTWIVTGANAAAERMHQVMPGEEHVAMVGRPITDFVPPEMREKLAEELQQVVNKGSDLASDVPIGPMFFDVNSALISYGNQQFIQMILHDVTQRREMMDSLLKTERLAAAGTFAAGVAHEVNNPLASISSLVQSLLSGESDSQRRTTLHTILSQITRISGTLKDLVNFARPATGHQKVIDINNLVAETLRVINYDKRFHGITLEPVLAADLMPAFADDNEIQQVLLNLLFNAADATHREGGAIRVITGNKPPRQAGDPPRIVIRICDNGIGIPREHLERVFDPFFTTKPAGAGVGLGLSLCQRIILSNQGTIRVDSEVGKGTEITILLPAHQVAEEQQAQAAAQP